MTTIQALLVGDDVFPFHDLSERGPEIEAAIGDAGHVATTTDRSRLLDLESVDVFVDYQTDSSLADDERDALLSFVEDGGGYLGLHCAADLTSTHDGDGGIDPRDEPFPYLRDLVGGHFLTHPEQATFGVEILEEHPVTDGVSDFEVFDEPYVVTHDPDRVTVLARMDHPDDDMDDYPVVWVREHGDGRVCYVSVGHTTDALGHEGVRRLYRNAIRWVAGE